MVFMEKIYWRSLGPSEMAKFGTFRIGKSSALPDWQKIEPFRIGKNRIFPECRNWDPSGLAKIAFPGRLKITPKTLPDTVSKPIMLYELTRKGIFWP